MRRYAGGDADNLRWEGFEFRDGDIVISAPSKCGTTRDADVADLPGELARLAHVLGYQRSPGDPAALAGEASLERMRDRAGTLAPNADQGLWKDNTRFFRGGRVGDWRTEFSADYQQHYEARVAELVRPDLARWVHHGRRPP